jgi:hypothetical protein
VVLSIWDGALCVATVRLAPVDLPELVRALTSCLVDQASTAAVG